MQKINNRVATPDSKVYGANMGPTWGRQDPGESHVDPMNPAILDYMGDDTLKYPQNLYHFAKNITEMVSNSNAPEASTDVCLITEPANYLTSH